MAKQIVHLGTEVKSYFGVLNENGDVLQPTVVGENGQPEIVCADSYRLGSLDDAAFDQLKSLIFTSRDKFHATFCQEGVQLQIVPGGEAAPAETTPAETAPSETTATDTPTEAAAASE